jgi:hypothetical protein
MGDKVAKAKANQLAEMERQKDAFSRYWAGSASASTAHMVKAGAVKTARNDAGEKYGVLLRKNGAWHAQGRPHDTREAAEAFARTLSGETKIITGRPRSDAETKLDACAARIDALSDRLAPMEAADAAERVESRNGDRGWDRVDEDTPSLAKLAYFCREMKWVKDRYARPGDYVRFQEAVDRYRAAGGKRNFD